MKKILYTTDFSENAAKAFSFAVMMTEKWGAELIMLHVFDIPTAWNNPQIQDAVEMERQTKLNALKQLEAMYSQENTDIAVSFIAVENTSIPKGVLSTILDHQPALLILGTKGGNKIKETLIGSTTKSLIRKSPIPVLAIPEQATMTDFGKVLYATDLRGEDVKALRQMINLLQPFNPKITIAHINVSNSMKEQEEMEKFKSLVKNNITYKYINFQLLPGEEINKSLQSYLEKLDFDLLAMLEKDRHGIINTLFHPDLVSKIEFQISMPVLSFNEHYLRSVKL